MPVNPAELKYFEQLAEEARDNSPKPLSELTIEEYRAGVDFIIEYVGKPAPVHYKDEHVTSRDGYQIPIRIYNDDLSETTPVVVFYPGCGYIIDAFEANAVICSRIAQHTGIKVIIVNYRLAPEHPLPIPVYDSYDVTKFVAQNSEHFNIDSDKIFICGLSSGANAAAVIANLARTDKDLNIYHQILVNGCYDALRTTHEYDEYEREDKLLNEEALDFMGHTSS